MKRHIVLLGTLLNSVMALSQVGINTDTPRATLEIAASPADATKTDGIIAPKLTGDQLKAKDSNYTNNQTGTIVYATSAASPTTAKTINVVEPGYYYFDGTVWQKFFETKNATVLKAFKGGSWNLLTLTGGWNKISVDAADRQIGAASLLNNGNYVAPSSGVYLIKYEIRLKGVNANLLSNSYLGLLKNGSTTPIEQKSMESLTLSVNLGLINLDLADVPVSGSTLNTLIELNKGDTLSLAFKTGISLGLLTEKEVSVYIFRISN